MFQKFLACFVVLFLAAGWSFADPIDMPQTRVSIVVDQSTSMSAPLPHGNGRGAAREVREGIASAIEKWSRPVEFDLWVQNPNDAAECSVRQVGDGLGAEAAVDAMYALRGSQRGIGLDRFLNPVSKALSAASVQVDGIILLADRLNDCEYPADRVCQIAAELSVPVNVISFALAPSHRAELACLAEVSGGVFVHLTDGREAKTLIQSVLNATMLGAQMTALEHASLQLANDIDHLSQTLDFEIRENVELRNTNARLAEENGMFKQRNKALEGELKASDLIIEDLRDKISDQAAVMGEQRIKIATLEQQLADAQARIVTLEEHIAGLIEERDMLHAVVVGLEGELTDLKVKLEGCNNQNMSLKDRIVGLEAESKKLEQTVIIATNNCEARLVTEAGRWQTRFEEQASDYDAQLELVQQTINDKTVELGKKDEAIGKLHTHIAELDEKIVSLVEELSEDREQNAVLTSENTKLNKIIVGLEATLAKLMTDLEQCRSKSRDLGHELSSVTSQLQHCQKEKSALEDYLKETKALLKSCETKLGAAHTKLSQLEAVQSENKSLREKISVLDDKYRQCLVDKATFLKGLSPLIMDHLEERSEATKP